MSGDREQEQDVPQQEPEQPQPQQEPEQQPQPQPEPAVERTDWRDRRIGEQQQRLRDRNARIAELEARLAQYQEPAQPQYQPQGQMPAQSQDIQRQINEAAARLASQQEFTRRCNDVAEAGRTVYNNFDQRVQKLVSLVDSNDPQQVKSYNDFLTAAMETGQAPRLIYELGGDLNEASRVMGLNAVKMAVELTKMSAKVGTTDASNAPRPLNPVASAAQSNRMLIAPDDPDSADTLSTEEWMKRREEQMATRRQRTLG